MTLTAMTSWQSVGTLEKTPVLGVGRRGRSMGVTVRPWTLRGLTRLPCALPSCSQCGGSACRKCLPCCLKPSDGFHRAWNEDPPLASVTSPCSYLLVFLSSDSPLLSRLQPRWLFKFFSLFLKHTRLTPPGRLCKAAPSFPECDLIHIPTRLTTFRCLPGDLL